MRRSEGERATETVCAVTGLGPERASAKRLLALARGHWHIEDRLDRVRDMGPGEGACRVRTGEAPEVLAAIRSAGLRVMRSSGLDAIAAALRRHAATPHEAPRLVMNFAPS